MLDVLLITLLMVSCAQLIDMFARSSVKNNAIIARYPQGIVLNSLIMLLGFGLILGLSGNALLSMIIIIALNLLFVLTSNAKIKVLGEPLLFSDLALLGAVFKHPQFYFSVLTARQKLLGLLSIPLIAAALFFLVSPSVKMALTGIAISAASLGLMAACLRLESFRKLANRPDIAADVAKLGLAPTLLLYWFRWRSWRASPTDSRHSTRDIAPPVSRVSSEPSGDEVIVIVQCESFSDPYELFDSASAPLAHLEEYRGVAREWGNLLVSGFGAYTMRTEYGVIFGRDEDALGFHLYDPYLTAFRDVELALPNRLGSDRWNSIFVHPHDMRFYGRNRILPQAGFGSFVGEDEFAPPDPERGRYVKDIDVAEKILQLADGADIAKFIYAVTMENHGPWGKDGDAETKQLVSSYIELVQAGDRMLGRLASGLASLKKPSTLVFFGDHRPSIPGAVEPGGDKHTPYLIVQFDRDGNPIQGEGERLNRTPAQLHHRILNIAGSMKDSG